MLVEHALDWFTQRAVPGVSVVTQGTTLPRSSFINAAVFSPGQPELWYHLWLR
jgi:hypothetical protein